ncbi:DNA-binding protein [Paenibacillus donghaensis]|uniref:DNA-binding protein n=1 Tax=Paenibacillus donghaensis TaxID=414771 RepID=A0A2Z2KR89_9BACL|nr:DNA-binding protein [Paenibacillus donghaensis]ASA21478.1 hypothetical protein B9T62_12230 [Paenibacillus donghaensis]
MELNLKGIQPDTLVEMLKLSFASESWDTILQIADKLHQSINRIYTANQEDRAAGIQVRTYGLERSVVYYFGYSMCLKGIAHQRKGEFSESRACIQKYADLSGLEGLDEESWKDIELYRRLSVVNAYVIDIIEGKVEVLEKYVSFLRDNPNELLPGLLHILQSSMNHHYSADWILAEFEELVSTRSETYTTQRNIRYYIKYIHLLSKYYAVQGDHLTAVNVLLQGLVFSVKVRDDIGFRQSTALFESMRDHTTAEQQELYKSLMIEVLEG